MCIGVCIYKEQRFQVEQYVQVIRGKREIYYIHIYTRGVELKSGES